MKHAFLAFLLITFSTGVFAVAQAPAADTSAPVPSKKTDSDGDGIPDFAQLDSHTTGALQLSLVNPVDIKTNAESLGAEGTSDKSQTDTALPDFLKWNIQEPNAPQPGLNEQTDRLVELDPESSIKLSPLRLGISMEHLSTKRRQFRISVAGISSSDQPVTVWVSTDLKTWNKVEDSMIETDDTGNRQIVVPLNSKIQFFRVSSPE